MKIYIRISPEGDIKECVQTSEKEYPGQWDVVTEDYNVGLLLSPRQGRDIVYKNNKFIYKPILQFKPDKSKFIADGVDKVHVSIELENKNSFPIEEIKDLKVNVNGIPGEVDPNDGFDVTCNSPGIIFLKCVDTRVFCDIDRIYLRAEYN